MCDYIKHKNGYTRLTNIILTNIPTAIIPTATTEINRRNKS